MTNATVTTANKPMQKKAASKKRQLFSKEQWIQSRKFQHRQDALQALLDAHTMYSYEQIKDLLTKFEKGGK